MKRAHRLFASAPIAAVVIVGVALLAFAPRARGESWANDPIWHDGLVEKAVYTASRVVYEKPRAYEAIFFTNREQHDRKTWTKADKGRDTVEVWKLNQVEVIPTPNYDYKYVTTAHLVVNDLTLTRLDCASQEFCGTSFKQYQLTPDSKRHEYWSFSYMPESGRRTGVVRDDPVKVVARDSLPLWLRDFPFGGRVEGLGVRLLPSQQSNRATPHEPVNARVKYVGEEGDAYKLELHLEDKLAGTYWMARDPAKRHIMLKYRGADGQTYDLKSVERVNYWTIRE
jgi:hypothetical protein